MAGAKLIELSSLMRKRDQFLGRWHTLSQRFPRQISMTLSSSQEPLLRECVNERLSQAQISAKIEPKGQGKTP